MVRGASAGPVQRTSRMAYKHIITNTTLLYKYTPLGTLATSGKKQPTRPC